MRKKGRFACSVRNAGPRTPTPPSSAAAVARSWGGVSNGSANAAPAVVKPKKGVPKLAIAIGAIAIFVIAFIGAGFTTDWFGLSKPELFSGTATLQQTDERPTSWDAEWNVAEDAVFVTVSGSGTESKYVSPDGTPHQEGDYAWYEVTGDREDGWAVFPVRIAESGPVGIWAVAYVRKNTPDDHFEKDYLWSVKGVKINEDGTCLLFDRWTLTDTVDEAKQQITEDLSANDAKSIQERYGVSEMIDGTWEKTSDNVVRMTFGSGDDALNYSFTLAR